VLRLPSGELRAAASGVLEGVQASRRVGRMSEEQYARLREKVAQGHLSTARGLAEAGRGALHAAMGGGGGLPPPSPAQVAREREYEEHDAQRRPVELCGLESHPQLNRTRGVVLRRLPGTDRLVVRCEADGAQRSLDRSNVRPVLEPNARVRVRMLRSKPQLNGTAGRVVAGPFAGHPARFLVECEFDGRRYNLQSANLEPLLR
jgi:hypothetical protein